MTRRSEPATPQPSAVRTLLDDAIDYAGLFPPAGLGMDEAVGRYAAGRRGPEGWMLARFAVPARRLPELERSAAGLSDPAGPRPWRLSAIGGDDPGGDLEAITAFNGRRPEAFVVDTFETRVTAPSAVRSLMKSIPAALNIYVELPFDADPPAWIAALAPAGARAKLRAGGVTADRFPSSRAVAGFLSACVGAGVPFKTTAGLHHALRSVQPLTYEPGSATALMHGLLNMLLAAALASRTPGAAGRAPVEDLLEERSPAAFRFEPDAVAWREHRIARADLQETRRARLVAVGSCSFDEPVAELKRMGVL